MPQKFLNVGEVIELLSKYDKSMPVAYIELDYGITPIVGVSKDSEYVYIDGVC